MFESTTFGKTVGLLKRSMDVAVMRREVIADNIANADVPNFKRSTLNFEAELKRALDSEREIPEFRLAVTDPRHLQTGQVRDWRTVEPRRVLDYLTTAKNNGNNVDAEEEMMASLQNQLNYTLQAQALNFEFSQVNLAMK